MGPLDQDIELLGSLLVLDTVELAAHLPDPVEHFDVDEAFRSDREGDDREALDPALEWFAAGSPVLVLVGVGGGVCTVAQPVVTWMGHVPQLAMTQAESVSLDAEVATLAWIKREVARVTSARKALFRTCVDCGESNPPEWMMNDGICQGCAERNHGVVF